MPNPNTSSQDWYYHAPPKMSQSEAAEPPPPSQIPGLSNVIDQPDEMEERQFRRKWTRDTDSKYIKLAKGGGRKNLLSFSDHDNTTHGQQAVGYPRVDWFDHHNPEMDPELSLDAAPPPPVEYHRSKRMLPPTQAHRVLPEWYVHDHRDEEKTHMMMHPNADIGPTKNKKNIVCFDNMSAWEREAKDITQSYNNRKVKLPPIQKKDEKSKVLTETMQFPKRIVVKAPQADAGPVNFSHLMSMGYQRDWFDNQNEKLTESTKKKQMVRMKNEEKKSK